MTTIDESGSPTTRPDFQMSVDTRKIVDRLMVCGIGETVETAELTEMLGRDVRNGAAGCLYSALRHVERHHDLVFASVRGVGYKRLSDAEIVASGDSFVNRSRRNARRGYRRLGCVQFDKLPEDQKVKHQTFQSVFSALHSVSKSSAVKRVEVEVQKSRESLPLAQTLEAFKS